MKATPVPVLRGPRVTLRPYRPDEHDAVLEILQANTDWIRRPTRDQLRRRIRRSGLMWRGRVILGIEADGRLVGEIQTYRNPGMPRDSCGLGIMLFDPRDRGRGVGTEAVGVLSRWVLESGAAARMEAGTLPSNVAMQRAFERTGWSRAGTERAFGRTWVRYELEPG